MQIAVFSSDYNFSIVFKDFSRTCWKLFIGFEILIDSNPTWAGDIPLYRTAISYLGCSHVDRQILRRKRCPSSPLFLPMRYLSFVPQCIDGQSEDDALTYKVEMMGRKKTTEYCSRLEFTVISHKSSHIQESAHPLKI